MIGNSAAREPNIFVFRLLGSIYEKKTGEQESHPTVVEIEVDAESEAEAERMIGASLKDLTETVERIRLQEQRRQEERRQQSSEYERLREDAVKKVWKKQVEGAPTGVPMSPYETTSDLKKAWEKIKDKL